MRRLMKQPEYPLHEACEFLSYCASEEGGNRKNCGDCPLHPRAARVFTPTYILQLILTAVILFLCGAVILDLVGRP